MDKPIKIAVITPGRSHLLDMSKQFLRYGASVKFYTIVPKSRCEKFGLPAKNVVSFFYVCAPLMFLFRKVKFPFDINRYIYYIICRLTDILSALFLKDCDILISISGCSLIAARKAQKKYGALFFCDRGAKHIIEQDKILKNIPNAKQVFKKDIPIELKQYDLADRIILPSTHTYESFIQHGFSPNRLFVNPYGVSLDMFSPINTAIPIYDVIFVGNLSKQKGGDLLIEVCSELKLKTLHVGSLSDVKIPQNELFVHVDPVNQTELNEYYSKAKILALPSRQDGFGLVLFQAMACGLPLVYSHNTGGPDLRALIDNKDFLIEAKSESITDLKLAFLQALDLASAQNKLNRNYLTDADKKRISWDGYGNRYWNFIQTCL